MAPWKEAPPQEGGEESWGNRGERKGISFLRPARKERKKREVEALRKNEPLMLKGEGKSYNGGGRGNSQVFTRKVTDLNGANIVEGKARGSHKRNIERSGHLKVGIAWWGLAE